MATPPAADPADKGPGDLAALARGGRINFFGFVLRLIARIPFLLIAGQFYGPEALGRFAYALIVVEFASQLGTFGLKRGLAKQLSQSGERSHTHVCYDALIVAAVGSGIMMAILIAFPQAMFPNSEVRGLERLLPFTVLALAWTEIMLAALAYRHNIGAAVRARAIVEPWVISLVAAAWIFVSLDDGLIVAYVASMMAAVIAAAIPFLREYGLPHGWSPHPVKLWEMARANYPLAVADTVEWGTRRVDIAVLGLFFAPTVVGIYYVAQQVASLVSKLKTSFDPILGPVISKNVAEGNYEAVASQVRQVGFWIIAAQAAVALALGIPAMAVMNLMGPEFGVGYLILGILLGAEVIAATAAVSEAALIYLARHRNMLLSLTLIGVEAALGAAAILVLRSFELPTMVQAMGPAIGLALALAFGATAKAMLLSRIVGEPVSGWRWSLLWAAGAALVVGFFAVMLPDWGQLVIGGPLIMVAFGIVIWKRGFGPEDRELFKMRKRKVVADPPA
ncbi:lipopolysaccharide biosynthesis protein [Sphingomicrobium nitratireducens]|uniref:lipopolysaccharide biosynthesis protein n=1 Tax=Sphingomicrobium nitratireducens TaxID=2964666 RepID=UPI002240A66C|nr:oligosaccharide flippase family protein [Sphingomicrobium nitratireducens]